MHVIKKKVGRIAKLFLLQSIAQHIWWAHFTIVAVVLAVLCEQRDFLGGALFFQLGPPFMLATLITVLFAFAPEHQQNEVCELHWRAAIESPLARLISRAGAAITAP